MAIPFNRCAEMDFVEGNGNSSLSTTWHAGFILPVDFAMQFPPSQPCNQFGCATDNFFDSSAGTCMEEGRQVDTS